MGESPGSLEEKGTLVGGREKTGEKELGGGCYVLQLPLMFPTDRNEKWTSFFFVQMYCAFLMPLFQHYMQHKFS